MLFFSKKNMPIYFVYYIYHVRPFPKRKNYHVRPPKKKYTMCVAISKSYILFCLIKLLYLKKLKNNNVFSDHNSFGFYIMQGQYYTGLEFQL